MNTRSDIAIPMILIISALIVATAAPALAAEPPTPFLIFGEVNYNIGDHVPDPTVTVENVNTGEYFVVELSGNSYQVSTDSSTDSSHVSADDVLHFIASNDNVTEFDHTVNETERNAGGFVQDITIIHPAAPKPDLVVSVIEPNCGGNLFGNESNELCAEIENIDGVDATAFNVSFGVDGFSEEVRISGLSARANTTVCVTDPTLRNAGDAVTMTVTADCNAKVVESNETNNASTLSTTVVNNGYKGKRYTGGEDLETIQTHTLNGNLLYSLGDSYYLSAYTYPDWTTYNASWAASDLPVPGTATIEEARLFVPYTWDQKNVMPDNVSMTFNGITQTRDAHYSDEKMYATSYPYGMLAYDVTDDFSTSGNVVNLTNIDPGGKQVSMRGMLLMVIYADGSEPLRKIIMNEEFDLLYGGSSKCTTPEEATAYAPFGAIDLTGMEEATLITVAPGAGPDEGELLFNGQMWYDVWNFVGTGTPAPQIGINETNVTAYLDATVNEAGFQSSADYMEASNAFLVVEYKPPEEKPDLVITEKSEELCGDTFTVTYTVQNIGDGDAGASNTTIYIKGTPVMEDPVFALAACATYTNTAGPFDCPCGTTVIITVCADIDNTVNEGDETNNCLENELECPPCGAIESYGNSVHYKRNVRVAWKALDEPDKIGALMFRTAKIAIELEDTIQDCEKVSVWVRRSGPKSPTFEVDVSSDGSTWTSIGAETCTSFGWTRYDFTFDWDNVKYIGIRKPGGFWRPGLMGLDAVSAEGW